jgi:protein-S-isoprenylcysteine O-methyltransferase Ste14
MKKITKLKITNVILLVLFACQGITGLAQPLMGDLFEILHPTVGVLLVITGTIHIILNWVWIKTNLLTR